MMTLKAHMLVFISRNSAKVRRDIPPKGKGKLEEGDCG